MKIRWTTSARRDFVNVVEFLRTENLRFAKQLSSRIETQLKTLKDHPTIGREG